MKELEEGTNLALDFSKIVKMADTQSDVIPVAVQNADTKEVILVAYVNQEALEHSLKTKTAAFWSTSRNELWIKGATSGETFDLLNVFVNCEQNSLLYVVRPRYGPPRAPRTCARTRNDRPARRWETLRSDHARPLAHEIRGTSC